MSKNEKRNEFLRHKDEITREYQKKIDALYTLYPEFTPNSDDESPEYGRNFNLSHAIRKLIEAHSNEEITSWKMLKWIKETQGGLQAGEIDSTAVSNALSRLYKNRELVRVSPEGAKPAVYKKPEAEGPAEVPF